MAEFLESGAYDKHVKQLRVALWQSVEASREEVLRTFPKGTRVSKPQGGFVLWIQLPDGYDGVDVYRKAAERRASTSCPARCSRLAATTSRTSASRAATPFDVMGPAIRKIASLIDA